MYQVGPLLRYFNDEWHYCFSDFLIGMIADVVGYFRVMNATETKPANHTTKPTGQT